MNIVFIIMSVQIALGALDNFWHHEFTEKLPSKPSARHELTMHAIRELLYGAIFMGLAWYEWHGIWGIVLVGLILTELVVTLIDFIIEDKTRLLPPLERVLHTILAINIGVFMAVFAPIVWVWIAQPSQMVSVEYGLWSWFFTACAIGVFAWGIRNVIAVGKLHILKVPEWQRKPFKKGRHDNPKTYLITGATGFIGSKLTRKLIGQGHDVIALSRDSEKVRYKFGPHTKPIENLDAITNDEVIHTIINLAGEPLIGGLWTKKRKQRFFDSRVGTTAKLNTLIARLHTKPETLINGSAIGFYGNRHDEILTETSSKGEGIMTQICVDWELEARKADIHGVRVVLLRIGIVLDGSGGALVPMLLSTKLCAGMIMGSGKQVMSWIDAQDLLGLITFADDNEDIIGTINATAPHPATQKEFMTTLGKALKRPVWCRAPAKIFRLLLGDMADIFLHGQHVIPEKAEASGYIFTYPTLHQSFERITQKETMEVDLHDANSIFYNAECPVCDAEMKHYCKIKEATDAPLEFQNIHETGDALSAYGLTKEDITKRMYVLKADGNVVAGADAFIEIWKHLPRYAFFAKLLKLPIIYHIAQTLYDGIAAPFIWRRYSKRKMGVQDA